MKKLENEFIDQTRWNEKGKSTLAKIEDDPENFLVDPSNFSGDVTDLIKSLGNLKNKKILEFGCGRGWLSVALAKLGANVSSIDIGENLIMASRKVAELNNVECNFSVGSIDDLKFDDHSFDYVVGNAILHHLPKKGVENSLSEAYRVLKPGGMAMFIEPIENSKLFEFLQNMIPIARRPSILQRKKWEKFLKEVDDRALSNKELINGKGHFRKVTFKYYGFLIRFNNLLSSSFLINLLKKLDVLLTNRYSPVKKMSQKVLIQYKK